MSQAARASPEFRSQLLARRSQCVTLTHTQLHAVLCCRRSFIYNYWCQVAPLHRSNAKDALGSELSLGAVQVVSEEEGEAKEDVQLVAETKAGPQDCQELHAQEGQITPHADAAQLTTKAGLQDLPELQAQEGQITPHADAAQLTTKAGLQDLPELQAQEGQITLHAPQLTTEAGLQDLPELQAQKDQITPHALQLTTKAGPEDFTELQAQESQKIPHGKAGLEDLAEVQGEEGSQEKCSLVDVDETLPTQHYEEPVPEQPLPFLTRQEQHAQSQAAVMEALQKPGRGRGRGRGTGRGRASKTQANQGDQDEPVEAKRKPGRKRSANKTEAIEVSAKQEQNKPPADQDGTATVQPKPKKKCPADQDETVKEAEQNAAASKKKPAKKRNLPGNSADENEQHQPRLTRKPRVCRRPAAAMVPDVPEPEQPDRPQIEQVYEHTTLVVYWNRPAIGLKLRSNGKQATQASCVGR